MRLYSPFSFKSNHKGFCLSRQWILFLMVLALASCTTDTLFAPKKVSGVVSVADGNIAQSGLEMLKNGGNAADAMGAMLMTGAVVMPSRMGLGAGGVCQILDPSEGRVKTLNFLSRSMSFDGNIATPSLSRGVYTLQNKYGRKPWREILKYAKEKAEKGVMVSDALAKDILHSSNLDSSWKKKKKGDILKQPNLAKTLDTLASSGAGVLYNGALSESIVAQSDQITKEDLKNFKASFMDSIDVSSAGRKVFFPNPSVLSSEAYMIWNNAQSDKAERKQQAVDGMKELEKSTSGGIKGVGLIAADKSGLVIVCSVSMGQPFGTGKLVKEGFFLGKPVKRRDNSPIYANFIETNPDVTDVTAAVAGVGDHALFDALNDLSYHVDRKYLYESAGVSQEDKDAFVCVECEKGYPNQVGTCKRNNGFYLAEEKE